MEKVNVVKTEVIKWDKNGKHYEKKKIVLDDEREASCLYNKWNYKALEALDVGVHNLEMKQDESGKYWNFEMPKTFFNKNENVVNKEYVTKAEFEEFKKTVKLFMDSNPL